MSRAQLLGWHARPLQIEIRSSTADGTAGLFLLNCAEPHVVKCDDAAKRNERVEAFSEPLCLHPCLGNMPQRGGFVSLSWGRPSEEKGIP